MVAVDDGSLLDKLDSVAPTPLRSFDAFPKLPASYKARSESRGLFTVLIGLIAFFLILNDISEFVWGWPDYEFGVDGGDAFSFMNVNVDMVVAMPCRYLSVDLRDVVGDRLYLSKGFRRDGTLFDVGQATLLKEHQKMLSAEEAVSQSRKSRGFFGWWGRSKDKYGKTFNYTPDGSACRIYGSIQVKKVTANMHVTSLGHGYQSRIHVPHDKMNMSHVITEFSFGPYFPEIVQPLDNSLEITHDPFVAYTYFLRVVPTTYVAPRSNPLDTAQYSVTHYTRVLEHGQGTPGIFFKFDIDPIHLTLVQRTSSLAAFLVRALGVSGGVFVCASWALRISTKALAVTGIMPADTDELAPTPAQARASGLRTKWGGESLRARPGSMGGTVRRQGNSWVVEGSSPYGSPLSPYPPSNPGTPYAGTPSSPYAPPTTNTIPPSPYAPPPPGSAFSQGPPPGSAYAPPASPYNQPQHVVAPPPMSSRSVSGGSARGLGLNTGPPQGVRSPLSPYAPGTPVSNAQVFPPTPANARFPSSLGGPSPPPPKEKSD